MPGKALPSPQFAGIPSSPGKEKTMHDLNSVLLEGTLTNDPVLSRDKNGVPHCLLIITSERYRKREDGMEKRALATYVDTKSKLAEQCMQHCHQGSKIRVVGSLQMLRGKDAEGRDIAQIGIDAEHLEVRPELTKKQEKEPAHESFER
jgi:single-stranded DNA-binding protein